MFAEVTIFKQKRHTQKLNTTTANKRPAEQLALKNQAPEASLQNKLISLFTEWLGGLPFD